MLRALTLAALLLAPAYAQQAPSAADDARARELYTNGALLYEEGRYQDAIVAWEEAHVLSQRPELLYNIANAQERLGLWQEALDTLNRYRVYAPADERERLSRRISNLERRLAEVTAEPLPAPVVRTEPTPPTLPTPSEPAVAASSEEPTARRWAPLVGMGVGVAGLTTGTVFSVQAQRAREEAALSCVDGLCLDSAAGALQKDRRSAAIADTAFVVGGVALIGGVVFSIDAAHLRVVPGGVRFSGTF